MLTKLKEEVQRLLTGPAYIAKRIGLTPNIVSVIGLTLAFFSSATYALVKGEALQNQSILLFAAVVLLLASGFCDMLDGVLARTYHQATVFGGFFDSLLDRYADAVVYTGVIIGGLCDVIWGLLALIGSLLVSYSRSRAESIGIRMESVGIAERAERLIILATVSVIAIFWPSVLGIRTLNAGIILLAVISNLTVLQRALYVYRGLKKKDH